MTAAELKELSELLAVLERTTLQTLQIDLKMPSRVAALKPHLTEKIQTERVKCAQAYCQYTAEDRSKVMHSDKSTIKSIRAFSAKVIGILTV